MKKIMSIVFALICIGAISAQNKPFMNSYLTQWQKVSEFEKQSLPKSASEEVNRILRLAIADKNSPQVIKALIYQGKYDLAIDAENDTIIFRNLNEMVAKSTDAVEKSVLHSMLGELYLQYYQKDSWTIDQLTALDDFVPNDMKEWTKNIFYSKVAEHLSASVSARRELERTDVPLYADVVVLGADSRRFFPSMYDFLSRRAIVFLNQIGSDEDLSRTLARKNITQMSLFAPTDEFVKIDFAPQSAEYNLWVLEMYRKLLLSLQERKMDKSVVIVELDKLNYLRQLNSVYQSQALPMLQRMFEKYQSQDFSVEIADKIAEFYTSEIAQLPEQDNLKREEKTKQLYGFLQENINKYPRYERVPILENRLQELTHPDFFVSGNSTFPTKGAKNLTVTHKNISSLSAKLYKIDSPRDVLKQISDYKQTIHEKRTFVREFSIPLSPKAAYLRGETAFDILAETPGVYMITFEANKPTDKENAFYFYVSDLAVFARSSAKDRYDFFVVNRTTGAPAKNAKVNIYKLPGNWNNSELTLVESIPVNDIGLAVYNKKIPNYDVFYHAVSGNDNGATLSSLPGSFYEYDFRKLEKTQERINLFTDRSLYRPGQTVYLKAIASNTMEQKTSLATNKSIEFTLRDANGREISKQTLRTNEFGSLSGEFVLPQGVLSGDFSINCALGGIFFRVEEYKRPTFEILFDKIEKTYKFGEEITLTGKAENYSGIKLQNASVRYRITRQQSWWWRWGGSSEHFAEGVATTDESGRFEIRFTPEKGDDDATSKMIYRFDIEAEITDTNGETQIGTYTVSVGDLSMALNIEIPEKWEKNGEEKIVISAKNLDGNDIKASGTYQVFSLHENDSVNRQLVRGNFDTGEQKTLKEELKKLPSGKYRILLQSADDRGNAIETEKSIILFAYSDKRPPVKTDEWLVMKNRTFSSDKPAEIIFGASAKVNVLYELWQENTLLKREWITLDNENRLFSLPYKPEYKNGVTLMLSHVKDGKFYAIAENILPEIEKKTLNVKLDVFRDKIRPGVAEEWRVSLRDAAGKSVLAEVLASMYDFSLDKIYPAQDWRLSFVALYPYYSRMNLLQDNSFRPQRAAGYISVPMKNVKSFDLDRFDWFDFSLYYSGRMMMRNAKVSGVQVSEERMVLAYEATPAPENRLNQMVTVQDASTKKEVSSPQIRRNFSETAFFFPQLRTNEKGETQIAFTVPESNTKWRFRLLAHDKNLNVGEAEAFTVSQKELMITPNMPRFLRQGDRTSISTKISNLSDENVEGSVRIEFFNPATDELINAVSVENRSQSFLLAKGASANAAWTFDVPADIDIIGVRIVAASENFSDGEQHALAVLPNRMLVTESLRMDVNGTQTKSFAMNRLTESASPTAQNYRLTLEFASNPAWYAVQALPVLSTTDNENAVSWFAAYYANTLGMHIGKTFPKVSAMIEAWKKQGGSSETLLSNIEKNEELKNVLLEETPWVLEAKNEAEQKQKLALLFDLNRSRMLTQTAIDKLKELQGAQGGWCWFRGFYPSVGITQYVLYGFNQLRELKATEFSDDVRTMQAKAISYIDAEAIGRFDTLKKYNKNWRDIKTISSIDLEYLYVRAAYPQYPLNENMREMIDFYTSVIEKNWTKFSLYERSLIAVLMQKNGKTAIVQNILKSYREHATVSDEMGMFWANNRAHVFMSQSATTVHTFIMDAFRAGGAKPAEIDDMKRWLLKQKQTQLWESTHATLDAVYALLSGGSDWFSGENRSTITLADKIVEPEKTELGTGYFKETWHKTEIVPQMGKVKIKNSGNAPAWGALYLQYFEDLDKISKTDASLDIEKILFTEHTDESGTKLTQISENNPPKVGDKVVVRLTVRADRDLEFVHLKDMRAACFEPAEQLSGLRWQNGAPYYQTSKDASTNFYFDVLPRGTYVFEYAVFVNRTGSYSNGITTIQCMYAPEFTSHTGGMRIVVKE